MNFQSSFKPRLIYVFRINDATHKGCLKVGETTFKGSGDPFSLQPNCSALNKAAKERINQYTATAGIVYELLHTELTLSFKSGQLWSFNDGEVHKILIRSGIQHKYFSTDKKANEWFVTDLETVKNAIKAAKEGRTSLHASEVSTGNNPIEFRPEQRAAIDQTIRKFKKANQFLWNAKMRFGKTLSALQVVKEMNLDRTLILTHRPVVDAGWYEDYKKIFYDRYDFEYGSKTKGEEFHTLSELHDNGGKKFIYFASMQDLRGSELVGGNFDKNDDVFAMPWDLVIIDEAHEGTKTDLGEAVIRELSKEHTKILRLSGTPFNLFDDYKEDEIYTWDYVMEQRAKAEWDKTHWGDPNPYACLPKLNIYTYDLSLELKKYQDEEHAFNFKEFFRTNEAGDFIHDTDIDRFLDLLASNSETSQYPYSTLEWRRNFRHSLWTVLGVKEARALKSKLESHPTFSMFKIVNVAGDGVKDDDFENSEALSMVNEAIGEKPEETWTITLSCGRLTTGVSVKEWTAVFMLSGSYSTSASSYMQTIFRVQTPATIAGEMKTECFVFDFAPDRTLKVLAETAKVSAKAGKTTESDEQRMGEFLNFCPVISFDGSKMSAVNVPHMMQQLKRVYVERVVRNGFEDGYLYNDNLLKLTCEELEAFEGLKKIIGQTKAMPKSNDVDVNNQGFTNEEYEQIEELKNKKLKRELTEEEKMRLDELKEKKKNRDAAISILRGISIRMPMILYGATITNEEEEISIDNFTALVDDLSWEEFMPKGVTKDKFDEFKKYYDKDIFAAAGKRIRALARAADEMDIEERIERITSIFTTFRNPDKETVLTPWRVVNMHLGDTLGGYVFYDETYDEKQRLAIPRHVDHGEVTSDVFSPDSKVLEINSKSGLYPLYVAYSIYRSRLKNESSLIPVGEDALQKRLQEHRRIWDEVLRENIFIICKTPMAKSITRRTLAGFREGVKMNVRYFEDLINQITNKKPQFISKVTDGAGYWKANNIKNMKFNAIVGNPPYQDESINNHKAPVYHRFIDIAYNLSEIGTLITPGRFLFGAGDTPTDWNNKILSDSRITVVNYFTNSQELFSNVDIKGGIAITMCDSKRPHGPIGTFTHYKELRSILSKVPTEKNLASIAYTPATYKLSSFAFQELPWLSDAVGRDRRFRTNIFEKASEMFLDEKPMQGNFYGILGLTDGNKRVLKWVKSEYVDDNINRNNYKVIVPKANGSGMIGEVLSTPVIGQPVIGHTETFISLGSFNTECEALALYKYICTKFTRALLGTLKVTQDNFPETWANIPLQDFTSQSDIDWSQSIPDIDRQLYAKYGLEPEEISFIESMIKPME